jgi:hypothetical protein
VDLDDPDDEAVDLTPFPGAKAFFELPGSLPGKAIVYCNKRNIEQVDVYELDIATGELTLVAEKPGKVAIWLSSRNGVGFLNPENQIDMYEAVERFLAEHLERSDRASGNRRQSPPGQRLWSSGDSQVRRGAA